MVINFDNSALIVLDELPCLKGQVFCSHPFELTQSSENEGTLRLGIRF